jgi:hypothetical protein
VLVDVSPEGDYAFERKAVGVRAAS